jgi:hypothetical protein
MQLGFTADMDNAKVPTPLLSRFLESLHYALNWRKPDASELAAFKMRPEFRQLGDSVIAVTDTFGTGAWVLENNWSGFPDPAEFVFVGFDGQGGLNALGYFEDWPKNWTAIPKVGH